MLAALARAADRAGAASLHLQTDTDNTTALALYERHGFERHHAYVNLRRPPALSGPAPGATAWGWCR